MANAYHVFSLIHKLRESNFVGWLRGGMSVPKHSLATLSICRTDTCRVGKVRREEEDPFSPSLISKCLPRTHMLLTMSNEAQMENG